MIKSVNFYPRYVIEGALFNEEHIVISISDTIDFKVKIEGASDILKLAFYDTKDESLKQYPPCKVEDVQKIIKFLEKYKNTQEIKKVIVHCEAGQSRSAAIALFVHAYTGCEFSNISKADFANPYIVKICKELSGLQIDIPLTPPPTGIIQNFFIID